MVVEVGPEIEQLVFKIYSRPEHDHQDPVGPQRGGLAPE
jgi:hypothetical protein